MKTAVQQFNRLVDYEIGETTAAATYYLAEIYADFSQSLTASERPQGLTPVELEQYELALEEQAYPFEEKAIQVHESNLKLISRGVYNPWIEKSLQKLAISVPARYDKPEESDDIIGSPETYVFEIENPADAKKQAAQGEEPETGKPEQAEPPDAVTEPETAGPVPGGGTAQPPKKTDRSTRR